MIDLKQKPEVLFDKTLVGQVLHIDGVAFDVAYDCLIEGDVALTAVDSRIEAYNDHAADFWSLDGHFDTLMDPDDYPIYAAYIKHVRNAQGEAVMPVAQLIAILKSGEYTIG